VLAQGGKPPGNPQVLAQGATPWNPRWLKASFLRHAALALLAWGKTPGLARNNLVTWPSGRIELCFPTFSIKLIWILK